MNRLEYLAWTENQIPKIQRERRVFNESGLKEFAEFLQEEFADCTVVMSEGSVGVRTEMKQIGEHILREDVKEEIPPSIRITGPVGIRRDDVMSVGFQVSLRAGIVFREGEDFLIVHAQTMYGIRLGNGLMNGGANIGADYNKVSPLSGNSILQVASVIEDKSLLTPGAGQIADYNKVFVKARELSKTR